MKRFYLVWRQKAQAYPFEGTEFHDLCYTNTMPSAFAEAVKSRKGLTKMEAVLHSENSWWIIEVVPQLNHLTDEEILDFFDTIETKESCITAMKKLAFNRSPIIDWFETV
jgi:hypothetical protein